MPREIEFTPTKTYATRDNLLRGIARANLGDECRYMVVRTEDGRYAAIFFGRDAVHNGGRIAWAGFTVVG